MVTRTHSHKYRGFTLVEILIVLVVIALLVVGAVPFIGRSQADARDDRRESDIALITAALERYYQDNGEYPRGQGSTRINSSWSTTADGSWSTLSAQLVPKYIDELPSDPSGDTGDGAMHRALAYDYYANLSSYCGSERQQMYILLYNFERRARKLDLMGDCTTSTLGPYSGASNYRVARDNSAFALTFCANENETCSFSGTKTVAYGASGQYSYKYNVSSSIVCNNATFGDPISGVVKKCYTINQ